MMGGSLELGYKEIWVHPGKTWGYRKDKDMSDMVCMYDIYIYNIEGIIYIYYVYVLSKYT